MELIDALILAGGLASRMNYQNKALIPYKNQELMLYVKHSIDECSFINNKYLSINKDFDYVQNKFNDLICFKDDYDLQKQGPLAALLSFYRHYKTQSDYVFVCPCDCPNINYFLIHSLYSFMLKHNHYDLICPSSTFGLESAIFIVKTAKLEVIEHLKATQQKLSLKNFILNLSYKSLHFKDYKLFLNINELGQL